MPTRGRRELAAKAVDYFWSQTYENKELLILDDEEDPSFTIRPRCTFYARRSDPMTIGSKRNTLCAISAGPIIAHWDSDDYYAPNRLAFQYTILTLSGKSVLAFHRMLFVNEEAKEAAEYMGDWEDIIGTSFMYKRDWWANHPFEDVMIQEDLIFGRYAIRLDALVSLPDQDRTIIARCHQGNTSKESKDLRNHPILGGPWKAVDFATVSIP